MTNESPFKPEFFEREDETPDEMFYTMPRLVVHLDEPAIAALRDYFREALPAGGDVLDLMSSWRSHLPEDVEYGRVVGLGMNDVELAENPQLTERAIWNLNREPQLPFDDAEFDAVLVTVSVQYLVRPVEVFADVARVLRPDGRVIVSFSNRMFPSKATRIWRYTDDRDHARLVAAYLHYARGFEDIDFEDRTPQSAGHSDPLYIVTARRAA